MSRDETYQYFLYMRRCFLRFLKTSSLPHWPTSLCFLLFVRFNAWSTSLSFIYSLVGSPTLLYFLSGCPPAHLSILFLAGKEAISLFLFTFCLLYFSLWLDRRPILFLFTFWPSHLPTSLCFSFSLSVKLSHLSML